MPVGSFVLAALMLSASQGAVAAPAQSGPGLDGLRDEFPGVLQAMQDTAAPSLQAVAADGRAGRVKRGTLVWASAPLTAAGEPVQRALQVDGDDVARPANPLVAAELPLDATSPFEVGSGPASFSVVPVSADDGRHTVLGDGVLHADTHTATDTLVRAVTGGVESYELLASADAPELFRYRIQGATPRPGREPGVVELVKGDQVVGTVTAPVVADASGTPLPASLTVDGAFVDFTVRHRGPATVYPVLADPLWTTDYTFGNANEGVEGLFYSHEPANDPSHYWTAATNASDGSSPWRGITIRPAGNRTYLPGDTGRASFVAPPGARITKADFRGVYRRNDADRQTIRLALYGDGPAVVDDFSNTLTFGTTPSIVLNAPPGGATSAQVWMFTPPCESGEADCPRFVDAANASRVSVDQLVVTLDDPGAPTTSIGGSVAALGPEWRKAEGTYGIDVSASDNGSGIASWRIVQRQGTSTRDELDSTVVPCDPRHNTSSQGGFVCPSVTGSNGTEIELDRLREGRIRIQAEATDFAGNTQDGSGNPLELRLDRTAPTLDPIGGSLLAGTPNRWQQLRGSKALTVKARDTYSGVKAADVNVAWSDGADDQTLDLCQPAGGVDQPCPTEYEGTVPVDADLLPDGPLTVTATARDHVGYESAEQSSTLYKDNTDPAATARGELTDLEGEWTNSSERTSVKLQGKDRRSGVARLELYATDASGRRLIDDIAVCDPATVDASQPDGHCPREVARDASVDLGDFDTGEVTLEAYATDAAGNRDSSPDSWDTYLDYDPPSAVSRINSIALNAETTRVSWTPASDEGSGIAGYEYRLQTADGSFTEWNTTPYPGAQIPTSFEDGWIEIRAKDKTGNRGPVASDEVLGYRAGVKDLVKQVLKLRKDLNEQLWPVIGGFVCGEAGVCKSLGGRDTGAWLAGEILSGLVLVGDIRDAALALFKADAVGGALAVAGLVPIAGDTAKTAATIRKFMKRTNVQLHSVMAMVARLSGKDTAATRKILDALTGGGYGRLRRFDVSHEGAEQLVRSGNDIGALTRRANLARRPLSDAERTQVESNLKQYWGAPSGVKRAEALGVECALRYLAREGDHMKILVSGRPDARLSRSGPDIVAYDQRKNRLIVIEAKGTNSSDRPLNLDKLTSPVDGKDYVQPSTAWLAAERTGNRDYMKYLAQSNNAQHQQAARMLQELADGKRKKVDLKVVHVRPDVEGAQAYGSGLDTSARILKTGRVDNLDIIDVPYPRS